MGHVFNIVLEKGEAKKPISEMTPEEVSVISERVFRIVKARAAQVGQQPVISNKRTQQQDKSFDI